ncbi:hypothetical protein AMTRI_Chr13g118230 [Amborella trichopoda]
MWSLCLHLHVFLGISSKPISPSLSLSRFYFYFFGIFLSFSISVGLFRVFLQLCLYLHFFWVFPANQFLPLSLSIMNFCFGHLLSHFLHLSVGLV